MRVKDLRQVNTIDQEITALQQQLMDLYQTRAALLETKTRPDATASNVRVCYDHLLEAWGRIGISLPPLTALEPKLHRALQLKEEWEAMQPSLHGALQVVLVPPVSLIGLPAHQSLRAKQRLLQGDDIVEPSIKMPKGSTKWRVLVVYAQAQGVAMAESQYEYEGKPATALGMQEYIALTLQLSQPIDTTTWTSFLSSKKSATVVYAGCRHGRYRFGINDIHGALDDDRFRPAIEVQA